MDGTPSGAKRPRHRWTGEKYAMTVLGAVVALVLVIVGGLVIFGGGDSRKVAVDEGSSSETAPSSKGAVAKEGKGKSSSKKSKSPSPSKKKPKFTPGDNPHTPKGVCGSGYGVIDKRSMSSDGVTLGTVYLLYNNSRGTNCVVTMKAVDIKKKTSASAWLKVKGGKSDSASGKVPYYAGPVVLTAKGVCVQWGGSISGVSTDSGGWGHCG